jgi:predicted amidohydrolase YtcJ
MLLAPEMATDPRWGKGTAVTAPAEFSLWSLENGHFLWLKAMEEKGCSPIELLRAATHNIATAYGKGKELGTLEPGKIADMLILDKNPLIAAENYRSIHKIIKAGRVVDRDALPLKPIFTLPPESPVEEEARYIRFLSAAGGKFPMCPCMGH